MWSNDTWSLILTTKFKIMKYVVSYISNSGFTVLNHVIEANSFAEAIESIKGDVGVQMILSCVKAK